MSKESNDFFRGLAGFISFEITMALALSFLVVMRIRNGTNFIFIISVLIFTFFFVTSGNLLLNIYFDKMQNSLRKTKKENMRW